MFGARCLPDLIVGRIANRFVLALARRDGHEIAFVDVIDRPRHAGAVENSAFGTGHGLAISILPGSGG